MTGWRAGWAIGPVELAEHLTYLTMCMLYGATGFVQDAALYALTTPLAEVTELRELYRRRAAAMIDEFARVGPLRAAHARGRDVPDARRALDGPQRRCVRATPARGGGRVGASRRGLRPERRGPRPDLRDDGRGSAARGLPADRAARGRARRGDGRSAVFRHTRLRIPSSSVRNALAERHALDRRADREAREPRLPGRSRPRDGAARGARARQAAAARGRGRRRQDRGREDARRRPRRAPDPAAVLRGHRRRARALRLELRAPDARDPPDRDRAASRPRATAAQPACTTCSAASSSCAGRCSTRSSTTTPCRRCC